MIHTFDLAQVPLREVNQALHDARDGHFRIVNPDGAHALAAGISAALTVEIDGSVGYYCAGMHQSGTVTIAGNASTGLAENMMSGTVRLTGSAMMSAGATAHGGLLVIEGDAGARCGISLKGADIVVGGNVGHMTGFMAQAGTIVVVGDAAADLGDSIYEAEIYVAGEVAGLGADCIEKELGPEEVLALERLLKSASMDAPASSFRRFGSARRLYHFEPDDIDAEVGS